MVAPWHVIMYIRHGRAFVDEYFFHQMLVRTTAVLDGHAGGPQFYIRALFKFFSPWSFLVPFALLASVEETIEGEARSRVLLLLVASVFVVYSLVQTKLAWYILPAYPPLALLVASVVHQALRTRQSLSFVGLLMATVLGFLLVPTKLVVLLGCAGSLTLLILLLTGRALAHRSVALVMYILLLGIGFSTLAGNRRLGLAPLFGVGQSPAATLARLAGAGDPDNRTPVISLAVGTGDTLEGPAILFYSDRPVQVAYSVDTMAGFVDRGDVREAIVVEKYVRSLSEDYEIQVLARIEPLVYASIRQRDQP
jgi:4-amino-4-deoxy-L-arabinose transferase-like glycosyltransferase